MYISISIILFICIIFAYFRTYRRSYAAQKVRRMCIHEKCQTLSSLVSPTGFAYDHWQDIFTSRVDAWQRHYDYCAFFDHTAPFFQMVFDYEPVYFNYRDRTWLIEFWKGQYGINTGCEVGIYRADTLLPPSDQKNAHYHAVTDEEMLPMYVSLYHKKDLLFTLAKRHWWLAGFYMGTFSTPQALHMCISITFPCHEMMYAFVRALREKGYDEDGICINDQTVTFHYNRPATRQQTWQIRRALSQWKNQAACKIYRWVTKPFCKNIDRLLYLYYFLPFTLRKVLAIQKTGKKRGFWI